MSRTCKLLVLALLLTLSVSSPASAIVRVTPTWSFVQFHGGYTVPFGDYAGIPTWKFLDPSVQQLVEFSADELYDPSYALGVNFGQIRGGHLSYSIGFRFSKHALRDFPIENDDGIIDFPVNIDLYQYDLDLDLNYYLANINVATISPYIGLGLGFGITNVDYKIGRNENDGNVVFRANAGFDLKLTETAAPTYWALSSVNSYDLLASGDRPRYLTIGGALRYYFK
jgi:hypothetical protein